MMELLGAGVIKNHKIEKERIEEFLFINELISFKLKILFLYNQQDMTYYYCIGLMSEVKLK